MKLFMDELGNQNARTPQAFVGRGGRHVKIDYVYARYSRNEKPGNKPGPVTRGLAGRPHWRNLLALRAALGNHITRGSQVTEIKNDFKLYLSTWLEATQKATLDKKLVPHRLLSYAHYKGAPRAKQEEFMEKINPTLEVMLDSGAYSAWANDKIITLDEYAAFILDPKNQGAFDYVVGLDVIPGKWGVVPTQAQIDLSAAAGWENYYELQRRLKETGITPIHVYHQGEDLKWLRKIIDECEYFGVSPGNDRTTQQKREWLTSLMPMLTDDKGWPIRKFHGFGVTSEELMVEFPWYSVDSTSWVLTGRFGACFIPLNGETHKVNFSAESPTKTEEGKHIDTYSKIEREMIRRYLFEIGILDMRMLRDNYCKTCGKNVDLKRDEKPCCREPNINIAYVMRDEVNVQYFLDFEEKYEPKPWKRSVEALNPPTVVEGFEGFEAPE